MMTVTRVEKHKRGFFGWIFLLLFWAFNLLMLAWLVVGLGAAGRGIEQAASAAERTGAEVGTFIGAVMIFVIWGAGAMVLGLFVLLTRGRKVIVETVSDEPASRRREPPVR